jgi:hypothetical protein
MRYLETVLDADKGVEDGTDVPPALLSWTAAAPFT